jgi:hypothetical protein
MPVFLGAARSRKRLQVVASGPVARDLDLYTHRASGVALIPEDEVHEAGRSDHGDVRSAQATARTGTSGALILGDRIPPLTTIGAAHDLGCRTPGEIRMAVYRHWLTPSGPGPRRTRMVRGRDLGDLVSPVPTALKAAKPGDDPVTRSISPAWTRT